MLQAQQDFPQIKSTFDTAGNLDMWYRVCLICFAFIMPFIRDRAGRERPGVYGLFAMIFLMWYACINNCPVMLLYFMVWITALIIQRVRSAWARRHGWRIHTNNRGVPWLVMLIPFVRTESAARLIEPILCLFGGALLCRMDEHLGYLVMANCFALVYMEVIDRAIIARQVAAIGDAELEARFLTGQHNQRRGV
jgi:hypothetical protein